MNKKIEIYTWSYCPFCVNAKKLLDNKGYKYEEHILDNDDKRRKELIKETGQDTVPIIFIDNKFIGGFDDLNEMNNQGKL